MVLWHLEVSPRLFSLSFCIITVCMTLDLIYMWSQVLCGTCVSACIDSDGGMTGIVFFNVYMYVYVYIYQANGCVCAVHESYIFCNYCTLPLTPSPYVQVIMVVCCSGIGRRDITSRNTRRQCSLDHWTVRLAYSSVCLTWVAVVCLLLRPTRQSRFTRKMTLQWVFVCLYSIREVHVHVHVHAHVFPQNRLQLVLLKCMIHLPCYCFCIVISNLTLFFGKMSLEIYIQKSLT